MNVNLDEQIEAVKFTMAKLQGQLDFLLQLKEAGAVVTVPQKDAQEEQAAG